MWSAEFASAFPDRDWILTRILWLSGTQPGFNRLGRVDTMRRFIYIHGSPDSVAMGTPGSIGCVRMTNRDIVDLFDRVPPHTPVDIVEYGIEEGAWESLAKDAGAVREQVFVHEQGVPATMEYDDWDPQSHHVVARGPEGGAIGTGRLLPDGHIGRLAVLPAWRRQGVGRALMCRLTEIARRRGFDQLELNAQTSAAEFYERLGYQREGEEFEEAGIAHVAMRRALTPQATE
jgi:predicted GNAT family N-acyltransferase